MPPSLNCRLPQWWSCNGRVKKGGWAEHRGKGMGSAMLVGVIEGARTYKCTELYLEVRCSNNEAVRLYQKMNFQIRNRLGSYYRDGEDAYLMSIELCE